MKTTTTPPYTALHKRKGGFDLDSMSLPSDVRIEATGDYAVIYAPSSQSLYAAEKACFSSSYGVRG